MIKKKSKQQYWEKFSVYQTFQTAEDLNATIKRFLQIYTVTPSIKAVLNTLKLYSKRTFVGVCWLYIDEICKKVKLSRSTVKRAIRELKEVGLLTVHENMHTEKGGKTHNVYVINPIFELSEEPSNEPSEQGLEEPSNLDVPTVSEVKTQSHKNPHTNSNKTSKDLSNKGIDIKSLPDESVLKPVPTEFIKILEPYYANDPQIIRKRWGTLRSALKNNLGDQHFDAWDLVRDAWKDVVTFYKRGKIKNSTPDGLGAYFYGVLNDYLFDYSLRKALAAQI